MLRSNSSLASKVYGLVKHFETPIGSLQQMLDVIDLGQKGGEGSTSRRTWILDPIDGTKTYILAKQYAVCLCLVEKEQRVGVLGCPNLDIERKVGGRVVVREDIVDLKPDGGWILSAVLGQGMEIERVRGGERRRAESDGRRTDGRSGGSESRVKLGFTDSSASSHTSKELHDLVFEHFGGEEREKLRGLGGEETLAVDLWAMQMKYVVLALRGDSADAMIRVPPQSDYHACVWDHAGGQLLLKESGGWLTDARGQEFVVDGKTRKLEKNWGVCVTRGGTYEQGITAKEAHEAVLEKVKVELERRK